MTSTHADREPDWLEAAAAETMVRLESSLASRFKRRQWKEFAGRLTSEMGTLFRLVYQLYGWRYDFAWILERLVSEALAGHAARPGWVARTLGTLGESQADQRQPQPELWAALDAPVPEGSDELIRDLVEWATGTGATHLHLRDSLPGKTICRALLKAGLGLVADIELDHVDTSHIWARAATAGSKRESDFFFLFPDRSGPDAYTAGMRSVGAKIDGDAFSWHAEVAGGRWIWTTHDPNSWDLDYRNPELFAAVVGRLIAIANRGVSRICVGGLPHVWKAAGTQSINLSEAHLIVRIIGCLLRVAAPWTSLVAGSEPGVSTHLPPHERFIATDECPLGYDPRIAGLIWEALTKADARVIGRSIHSRYPDGCYRVASLRDHANESPDAKAGLDLAVERTDRYGVDLAARRILAAFAIMAAVADVPEIALGDLAVLDVTAQAAAGDRLGPDGLLRSGLARLMQARQASERFVRSQPIRIVELEDTRVLALLKGRFLVLVNLSADSLAVSDVALAPDLDFDLVSKGPWPDKTLGSYAFRYLVATNSARHP